MSATAISNVASISRRLGNTKRRTISRLLDVARAEFADKGLDGARIDEIARRAGITKQLIYHYYSSKEELFGAVVARDQVAKFRAGCPRDLLSADVGCETRLAENTCVHHDNVDTRIPEPVSHEGVLVALGV